MSLFERKNTHIEAAAGNLHVSWGAAGAFFLFVLLIPSEMLGETSKKPNKTPTFSWPPKKFFLTLWGLVGISSDKG